jgi:arylsulfatase A-like enzyme
MLRTFLSSLALLLLLLSAGIARAAERPNFLFIYTDDQRWDALGVVQREQGEKARFPWFETPNLDRLASEGVRFRNAFVVNSLCAPSRSVFLTGR